VPSVPVAWTVRPPPKIRQALLAQVGLEVLSARDGLSTVFLGRTHDRLEGRLPLVDLVDDPPGVLHPVSRLIERRRGRPAGECPAWRMGRCRETSTASLHRAGSGGFPVPRPRHAPQVSRVRVEAGSLESPAPAPPGRVVPHPATGPAAARSEASREGCSRASGEEPLLASSSTSEASGSTGSSSRPAR